MKPPALGLLLLALSPALALVSVTRTRSITPTVSESPTVSATATGTSTPTPPSPLPAPSYKHLVVPALVCGNDVCEDAFRAYGETCGNCPVDCGPCQETEDAGACVANNTFALTFEGGPSPATPALLNTLLSYSIKATFFVVGNRLPKYTEYFTEEAAAGHSVFGSTFTGGSMTDLTLEELYWQVANSSAAFQSVSCRRPMLYRPPGWQLDDSRRGVMATMGMRAVGWNLDSQDAALAATNPLEMMTELRGNLNDAVPGPLIVRQSDATAANVNMTPSVIYTATVAGYKFVSVEECLWGSSYEVHPSWVWDNAHCSVDWAHVASLAVANNAGAQNDDGEGMGEGAGCPVSDWSVWSPCDAACGVGAKTRVRLSLPPSRERADPACKHVAFTQARACVLNTLCPSYVWDGQYTDKDGSGRTVANMAGFLLPLSVCGFGQWRWPNATVACSKPCGVGTQVQVRDWQGYGAYTPLCGPLTVVRLCSLHLCPVPQPGAASIVIPLAVGLSITACILFACVCLCLMRPAPPPQLAAAMAYNRQQSLKRLSTGAGRGGALSSTQGGGTAPVYEHIPAEYFDGGRLTGSFLRRLPVALQQGEQLDAETMLARFATSAAQRAQGESTSSGPVEAPIPRRPARTLVRRATSTAAPPSARKPNMRFGIRQYSKQKRKHVSIKGSQSAGTPTEEHMLNMNLPDLSTTLARATSSQSLAAEAPMRKAAEAAEEFRLMRDLYTHQPQFGDGRGGAIEEELEALGGGGVTVAGSAPAKSDVPSPRHKAGTARPLARAVTNPMEV